MRTTLDEHELLSQRLVRPQRLPGRRRHELGALWRWILGSWRRPADHEVRWEQRAGLWWR